MEFDWEGLKGKLTAEGGIRNKSITVTREDMTGIPRPVTGTSDGIYPVREGFSSTVNPSAFDMPSVHKAAMKLREIAMDAWKKYPPTDKGESS